MSPSWRKIFSRSGKAQEHTNSLINRFLAKDKPPYFREGEFVRLDYEKITSEPDYSKKVDRYKQFVEENRGAIFTVEYDERHTHRPSLVCFAEDPSPVKWLWFTGDLELVKEA